MTNSTSRSSTWLRHSLIAALLCVLAGILQSSESAVSGVWISESPMGSSQAVMVLRGDGSLLWCGSGPTAWKMTGRYVVDDSQQPRHITFSGFNDPRIPTPEIRAIYEVDAQGALRWEPGENPATRPIAWSPRAITCRRATAEQVAEALSNTPVTQMQQPDRRAWSQLKIGMTADAVSTLLGEPVQKSDPPSQPRKPGVTYTSWWRYGRLQFPSESMPGDYQFLVFMTNGAVSSISDPFGGAMSADGTPTVPKQVVPAEGAVFDHYPRFVDVRWMPSAGDYPMRYEVDVESQSGGTGAWRPMASIPVEQPYAAFGHVGANAGRWRVRAVNALGASTWSEWRHFSFSR